MRLRILAAAVLTAAAVAVTAAPAEAAPAGTTLCGAPYYFGSQIGATVSTVARAGGVDDQLNPGSGSPIGVPVGQFICTLLH